MDDNSEFEHQNSNDLECVVEVMGKIILSKNVELAKIK